MGGYFVSSLAKRLLYSAMMKQVYHVDLPDKKKSTKTANVKATKR